MDLQFVIVHRIEKEQGTKPNLEMSSGPPPEMELAADLVERLHSSFDNNVTYGRFNDTTLHFRRALDAYLPQKKRSGFVSCTRSMISELASRLSSIGPARGGYFVFAHYTNSSSSFFSVFLIRNTQSMLFRRKGDLFSIAQTTHVDLDKLAMAARINLGHYSTLDGRYVSLIKRRIPDISDYFMSWIGVIDAESNTTDTQNLKKLLTSGSLPPLADGNIAQPTELLDRAYSFIRNAPGLQVSLAALSEYLFGMPAAIQSLAEESGLELNSEFRADSRILSSFRIISAKVGGFRLDFPMQEFQDKVRVDTNNPTQVVIEYPELARRIVDATHYV